MSCPAFFCFNLLQLHLKVGIMTQIPGIKRKLTAILAADAANFSARMQADEVGTVQALRRSRDIFESRITMRGGRIANTAGDGLIADFQSVVEAVSAAVSIQRELESGEGLLPFRIGLHLGDVIIDGDDILGDGVNLAARLQDMAREGGILATQQVIDQAKGRLDAEFRPLGLARPKGFADDLAIYAVVADGVAAPPKIEDLVPQTNPKPVTAPTPRAAEKVDKYKSLRGRNRIFVGGFALLDLVTMNGFGWCLWPITAFLALQGLSWYRLPEDTRKVVGFLRDKTPVR